MNNLMNSKNSLRLLKSRKIINNSKKQRHALKTRLHNFKHRKSLKLYRLLIMKILKNVAELPDKLDKTNNEQIAFILEYIDQLFIAARLFSQSRQNQSFTSACRL